MTISPFLRAISGPGFQSCRFIPSCSEYARDAVEQRGFVKGTLLAIHRVAHCHPWSTRACWDPVSKISSLERV